MNLLCHVFPVSVLHSSKPVNLKATVIADKEHHQQADPSMSIMRVADLVNDRTWDLEIRSSIKSRQLVAYKELKEGWQWDGQEVLTADIGKISCILTCWLIFLYYIMYFKSIYGKIKVLYINLQGIKFLYAGKHMIISLPSIIVFTFFYHWRFLLFKFYTVHSDYHF